MTKFLVARCHTCGEPLHALSVAKASKEKLGFIVSSSADLGRPISIEEQVSLGACECPPDPSELPDPTKLSEHFSEAEQPERMEDLLDAESTPKSRWTSRQILYFTAVAAVFLAIFQTPISLMLGSKNWAFVNSPWLLYRWFFLGTPMPAVPKGPPAGMDLLLFMLNCVLAFVVGVLAIKYVLIAIRYGYRKVST